MIRLKQISPNISQLHRKDIGQHGINFRKIRKLLRKKHRLLIG
jgi:hypothetical protein